MSSSAFINWEDDSAAKRFAELCGESRSSGYLSGLAREELEGIAGCGVVRVHDPVDPSNPPACSLCGEPIRPVREGDGLDPRDFDWTHEDGNPICGITPQATP